MVPSAARLMMPALPMTPIGPSADAAVAIPSDARYQPRFSRPHDRAGLPVLDDEVQAFVVDPFGWEPMRTFSAGGPERGDATREVNESARKLHAGHVAPQEAGVPGPPFQRVVALVHAGGALVGWCAVSRRHLCEVPTPFAAGAYIFALGSDRAYRGCLVSFEGELMRPGSAVMIAALRQVARDWGGAMPYVWARVKPHNRASHLLFDRYGFASFPGAAIEWVRVRPAGLAPP